MEVSGAHIGQRRLIGWAVITLIALIVSSWFWSSLFTHLDAQHVLVVQAPVTGTLTIHQTPGLKWLGFGTATQYPRRSQYWFSAQPDQGSKADQSIKVRFNDGGHAQLSGSLSWEIPLDNVKLLALHKQYGAYTGVEQQLVRTDIEKAVYMTGPLMSSKESYAERRNDLIRFIEDQVQNGVYRTEPEQVKEPDPMTGQMRTVYKVRLVGDGQGNPTRQEPSPLSEFGIRTFNLSINSITYDQTIEAQIGEQQKAMMNVQTAIANAKKAEQDALTAAKNGEAVAATEKWKQEAIKAQAVTEGEQRLAVAELDRKTAEQKKQEQILLGQGEAERRKLVMAADGALEKKLAAYIEVNKLYADALKEIKVPIVPSVQMGGEGGRGGPNGADSLIQLWQVRAAHDLSLDLGNGQPQKK